MAGASLDKGNETQKCFSEAINSESVILSGKESACNAGDTGSIPGSGRSPEEGNRNPLQYSSLENPTERSLASPSP